MDFTTGPYAPELISGEETCSRAGDQTILNNLQKVGTSNVTVRGLDVDEETRCRHYNTSKDIVAIKFPCCGTYYACIQCHRALAGHDASRWPADRFGEAAVLCGACGMEIPIHEYLSSNEQCPRCNAAFNPACRKHNHLYFEIEAEILQQM